MYFIQQSKKNPINKSPTSRNTALRFTKNRITERSTKTEQKRTDAGDLTSERGKRQNTKEQ